MASTRLSNGRQPLDWAEHGLIDQSSEVRCDPLRRFWEVNDCRRENHDICLSAPEP